MPARPLASSNLALGAQQRIRPIWSSFRPQQHPARREGHTRPGPRRAESSIRPPNPSLSARATQALGRAAAGARLYTIECASR